ncbi:MAG: ABC transporter ATP-binding protein, partial [Bacteroidota bacterium]|nr:ABC transporter ATP-binding protein [Bacteroidota bacterium]
LPEFSLSKDAIMGIVSYYLNYYKESQGFFTCLLYICMLFTVFTFLSNVFRYLGLFFVVPIRNGILNDLRIDIYKKLTNLPIAYFSGIRRGDVVSRLTSDCSIVEWTAATSLQMVVKDPLKIIIFALALFLTNWQFMLLVLVILPLPMYFIRKISTLLNKDSLKTQRKAADLLSFSEEAISTIKTIKGLRAEKVMQQRFNQHSKLYQKNSNKVVAKNSLASPLSESFSMIILSLVIIAGGLFVLKGQMDAASLIAFTVVFSQIISPIKELITAYYNFKRGEAAAKRIYEILDAEEKIEQKPDAIVMQDFKEKIEFKNVGFEYEDNNVFSLNDINFSINKGEKVAIVGASGAGKTTIFDLLPRFADVTKGAILIDGIDIRDFNINSLRKHIGLVTQNSILFNDSIYNNIVFGMQNIDMEEVKQAARLANIDEFIESLPEKYQTNIGDNGTTLSGGQRQRICIARTLLRNPQILFLDEATSAMDTENERKVSSAIKNAMQNRTIISIAHRLSTITDADKIIVMDNGRIVESGTHKELLEKNGYYTSLVNYAKISQGA